MNDAIICEKCGSIMESYDQEHTASMICPKCGWGWAATHYQPIEVDRTEYAVFLQPGNSAVIGNIKLIAEITGANFIQAKKLLASEKDELVYKAKDEPASTMFKAQRVQAIARRLQDAGIRFKITPDFPFEV